MERPVTRSSSRWTTFKNCQRVDLLNGENLLIEYMSRFFYVKIKSNGKEYEISRPMPDPEPLYRPRNPKQTPYYRCVEDHLETLESVYEDRLEMNKVPFSADTCVEPYEHVAFRKDMR